MKREKRIDLILGLIAFLVAFAQVAGATINHKWAVQAVRRFTSDPNFQSVAHQIGDPLGEAFDHVVKPNQKLASLTKAQLEHQSEFLRLVPDWYQASGYNVTPLQLRNPFSGEEIHLLAYVIVHDRALGESKSYEVYFAHADGRPLMRLLPPASERQEIVGGEGHAGDVFLDNPVQQAALSLERYLKDVSIFRTQLLAAYRFLYMDVYQLPTPKNPKIESVVESPFETDGLPFRDLLHEIQRMAGLKLHKLVKRFGQSHTAEIGSMCGSRASKMCREFAASVLWALSPHARYLSTRPAPIWPLIGVDVQSNRTPNPLLEKLIEGEAFVLVPPYESFPDGPAPKTEWVGISKTLVPLFDDLSGYTLEIDVSHQADQRQAEFNVSIRDQLGRHVLSAHAGHSLKDVIRTAPKLLRSVTQKRPKCSELLVRPPLGKII